MSGVGFYAAVVGAFRKQFEGRAWKGVVGVVLVVGVVFAMVAVKVAAV